MPTSHDTFRDQLLDLAYGELGRREARALRAHLEGCAACRAELERMGATRAAMSALGPEPAPARGEAILLAAAREAARERQRRPFLPSWLWGASVGAVAVVAVAVVSVKLAGTVRSPTEPPSGTELVSSAPAATAPPVNEPEARYAAAHAKKEAAPEEKLARADQAPARRPTVAAPAAKAERRRGEVAVQRAAPARDAAELAKREQREEDAWADSSENVAGGVVGSVSEPAAPPAAPPAPPAPPPVAMAQRAPAQEPLAAEAKPTQPLARAKAAAPAKERAADAPEDPVAREQRLRVAGRLRTTSATFPGCAGESSREVEQDERGRVVKLTRRGAVRGTPFQAELFYGEDGRLGAVRYQAGGAVHELRLDAGAPGDPAAAGVPAWALEPRGAADAGPAAPPRCTT